MKVNSLQLADPIYNNYSLFKILTAAAAHIAHYYQARAERAQARLALQRISYALRLYF
jgi:hypothetical protein